MWLLRDSMYLLTFSEVPNGHIYMEILLLELQIQILKVLVC